MCLETLKHAQTQKDVVAKEDPHNNYKDHFVLKIPLKKVG